MSVRAVAVSAGVVGHPISHSLSPVIHGAWIEVSGLDAGYFRVDPGLEGFETFARGAGRSFAGVNVTIPFKEQALALADEASDRARLAGAANLLLFREDGTIFADNTDGLGMLGALDAQAPGFDPKAGPAVILGAGGAARGAAAALFLAGTPEIRIVNRTLDRAEALARDIGPTVKAVVAERALAGANLIVNATSLGLGGGPGPNIDLTAAPKTAVVLDLVYKPLRTEFLQRAAGLGLRTVDGLEMLIRQAVPSFEAFFGQPPPAGVNVRALALKAVGEIA